MIKVKLIPLQCRRQVPMLMIELGKPVVCRETNHEQPQANQKFPKTNKEEITIESLNLLFADSGRASTEIPEWLQEIRENLVDDEVPEHRDSHASSSHEVSLRADYKEA